MENDVINNFDQDGLSEYLYDLTDSLAVKFVTRGRILSVSEYDALLYLKTTCENLIRYDEGLRHLDMKEKGMI